MASKVQNPKVQKSDEEWREQLSDLEYWVTRQAGTERPFTGILTHNKESGTYLCTCCNAELFSSEDKFDSGCGWPSFSAHLDNENISFHEDRSHGMIRVEVRCAQCEAHLGHVFDDGPRDRGGKRYCINSVSLQFTKPNDAD